MTFQSGIDLIEIIIFIVVILGFSSWWLVIKAKLGFVNLGIWLNKRKRINWIYLVPVFFIILALASSFLRCTPQHNKDLSILFGVASVTALLVSILVLISVQKTYHDLPNLFYDLLRIIKSARHSIKLLMIAPNFGQQFLYKSQNKKLLDLYEDYEKSLLEKIDSFLKQNKDVKIQIIFNNDNIIARFLNLASSYLEGLSSPYSDNYYKNKAIAFLKELQKRHESSNEKFIIRRYRASNRMPPLTLFIVDDHRAIIIANEPFQRALQLSSSTLDYVGHAEYDPDVVLSYSTLFNDCWDTFADPHKNFTNAIGALQSQRNIIEYNCK